MQNLYTAPKQVSSGFNLVLSQKSNATMIWGEVVFKHNQLPWGEGELISLRRPTFYVGLILIKHAVQSGKYSCFFANDVNTVQSIGSLDVLQLKGETGGLCDSDQIWVCNKTE